MSDHNVCRALLRSIREMAREAGIKIPGLSTRAVDGREMHKRYQICIGGKPGPFLTAHCALDAKTKHILASDECSAIPCGTVHESQEVSEGASQERKHACAILRQASRVVRQDEANRNVPTRKRWKNDALQMEKRWMMNSKQQRALTAVARSGRSATAMR